MAKRKTPSQPAPRRADASAQRGVRFGMSTSTYSGNGGYSHPGPSRVTGGRAYALAWSEAAVATSYRRLALVEACRDAWRRNPVARRIIMALVQNTIGAGFRVTPQTSDAGWNRAAADLYTERCKREHFSPDETQSEWELFTTAGYSYYREGGVLIYHPYGGVQLFEEGQIVTPSGKSHDPNVIDGLVFNRSGRLQGYYVGPYAKTGYVGDHDTKYLPAWHVDTALQVKLPVCTYVRTNGFASGVRGIPPLSPALDDLDRLEDYIDAILERAIEEACVMGTLTSDDPNAGDALHVKRSDDTASSTTRYETVKKLEPGIVPLLKKGEEFKLHAITTPGGNFTPFVHTLIRLIGNPVSMPMELSLGNFSETNFSASRAAIEQFKLGAVMDKRMWAECWSTPNYLWCAYEALRRGDLTERDDWQRHAVSPSGWRYLDPSVDAQAASEQRRNRTATMTQILAERGRGLTEHLVETADEILEAQRIGRERGVPWEVLYQMAERGQPPPSMTQPATPATEGAVQ